MDRGKVYLNFKGCEKDTGVQHEVKREQEEGGMNEAGIDVFDHFPEKKIAETEVSGGIVPFESVAREGIDPLEYFKPGEGIDPLEYFELGEGIDPLIICASPEEVEEKHSEEKNITAEMKECSYEVDEMPMHSEIVEERSAISPTSPVQCFIGIAALPARKQNLMPIQSDLTDIVKTERFTATNFQVLPVRKLIFIDREGREDAEQAAIESIVQINGVHNQMIVKVQDIRSITRIVQNKFPEAIVDFEEKKAEKMIEIRFRNAVKNCESLHVYFQAGWQSIAGKMVYLRDGMLLGKNSVVKTGMTLPSFPCYGGKELLSIFEKIMSIYQDIAAISAIFAFSLMGILYRPFRDAGYSPHFSLFLHGITGSMKTTIAIIFFVQLCEERYRERIRRIDADTAVSLERGIVSAGYDTVTLIDDFAPAKTETKKREMEDKLEMIIRMVGDGNSRSRSNISLEDRRGEGVHGMVALTGELMGKGLSSNLRCFYCKIEKNLANVDVITWFQQNPYVFTTLLATFADFVADNYVGVIGHIQNMIHEERERCARVLRELRLIDSTALLSISVDIFAAFLSKECGLSPKAMVEKQRLLKAGILESAVYSEKLSSEESPGEIFVRTVAELMRVGSIVLNAEKVKMTERTEYDGFEDAFNFYFNAENVHKKVISHLNRTNRYCPYDPKEMLSILADEGIIKTAPNGSGKRTFCVRISVGNGMKYNFLKINKTIFQAICDGNFENGRVV